jgi:hypothetical protein
LFASYYQTLCSFDHTYLQRGEEVEEIVSDVFLNLWLKRHKIKIDKAKLVGKFRNYSGKNEIEAFAADNELGYVYCSDEGVGIRKYYAHPDSSNTELALFGTKEFTDYQEG